MLESWTRKVVHARLLVLLVWLLLIIFGIFSAPRLNNNLTTSLSIPSSESAIADHILRSHFDENAEGAFVVLYKFTNATKDEIRGLETKIVTAASKVPTAKVTEQRAIGGFLFANIGTSFDLTQAASQVVAFRQALADEGLTGAMVTGPPAIYRDVTPVLSSDLHRGQTVAILVALLFLLLLLGFSWAVLIPYIFAGATISLSLGIVFLLSQKLLMVLYIPNILELIGLGLAIDYSLLIVHRFRQEILNESNVTVEDSVVKTMGTAGRTVIVSGLSVSVGLATLIFVPIPFIRSLGAAGFVVPLVSVLAATTLQPALLSVLGKNGVTPRIFHGLIASQNLPSGFFARIARFVAARPRRVSMVALSLLILVASSILWIQVTPSSLTAIPSELESARALSMVTNHIGQGVIAPIHIIIDLGPKNTFQDAPIDTARKLLAKQILKDPEVFIVATDTQKPFVDSTGRYIRMLVIGHHDLGARASQKLVKDLRENYLVNTTFPNGTKFFVGGAPAQGADLVNRLLHTFPWFVLLALIFAYLILLRAFRSVILPLISILLALLSLAVAYGVQVWVFKFGIGSTILGTYKQDQIEIWVIVFLFAVLFGLSMDYEVFIVARMREAKDQGASHLEAISKGLVHTGGVVTAAAIILVGALSGFVIGHFAGLQQLGVGLAFGVLIDATVIRLFLLPSILILLGRWVWWLPPFAARIVKTKASPLPPRSEPGERDEALELWS